MGETDLFFHLKIGQLILARRAIPFRNLFSFTFPEAPDPDLASGFQVLVALLYRVGGFSAIVLAKALLVGVAAWLAHRTARRLGAKPAAAALAVIGAALAAEPRMVERPHLVTFVGLGIVGWVLAVSTERPRLLWILPPLAAAWASCHAGVFFAPLVTGLAAVGAWLDRRRGLVAPSPGALGLASLGCGAACFAQPAGILLPRYLLWHTGLGATRAIEEFRAADPWDDPWFFTLLAGVAFTMLLLRRRAPLVRLLPVAAVALLAARSVRFVAEWALLAAPLFAEGLDRAIAQAATLWPRLRVPSAIALCGAVTFVTVVERSDRGLDVGLDRSSLPLGAIDFVTRQGLRDRLYADLDVGCYLLWEGWPRYRVFQDARLPAYPDDFHRALDEVDLPPAAWDRLLARYGVEAALITDPGRNLRAGAFDPETWALVWRDATALVFARRTDGHRALIAEREIPLALRSSLAEGTVVLPLGRPPAGSPVDRCTWDARLASVMEAEGDPARALAAREEALAGGCLDGAAEAEVRYLVGARLQRAGRLVEAVAAYDRAIALDPSRAAALANRGFALLTLARDEETRRRAREDLSRALRLDPSRADVAAALSR